MTTITVWKHLHIILLYTTVHYRISSGPPQDNSWDHWQRPVLFPLRLMIFYTPHINNSVSLQVQCQTYRGCCFVAGVCIHQSNVDSAAAKLSSQPCEHRVTDNAQFWWTTTMTKLYRLDYRLRNHCPWKLVCNTRTHTRTHTSFSTCTTVRSGCHDNFWDWRSEILLCNMLFSTRSQHCQLSEDITRK